MERNAVDRDIMVAKYIPAQVRLLFVGEAPPASGRFFYQQDSGLYRAFRDAFQLVDPKITDANFLEAFQAAGCYLIDLCNQPVDQLTPALRRAACLRSEPLLARSLKVLQPEAIVTVVHSIRANVDRAISLAGWNGQRHELPYPGRWKQHRELFTAQLAPLIERRAT